MLKAEIDGHVKKETDRQRLIETDRSITRSLKLNVISLLQRDADWAKRKLSQARHQSPDKWAAIISWTRGSDWI